MPNSRTFGLHVALSPLPTASKRRDAATENFAPRGIKRPRRNGSRLMRPSAGIAHTIIAAVGLAAVAPPPTAAAVSGRRTVREDERRAQRARRGGVSDAVRIAENMRYARPETANTLKTGAEMGVYAFFSELAWLVTKEFSGAWHLTY